MPLHPKHGLWRLPTSSHFEPLLICATASLQTLQGRVIGGISLPLIALPRPHFDSTWPTVLGVVWMCPISHFWSLPPTSCCSPRSLTGGRGGVAVMVRHVLTRLRSSIALQYTWGVSPEQQNLIHRSYGVSPHSRLKTGFHFVQGLQRVRSALGR
ncbi:hypothetical protein BJY04DRAFT_79581 [Aspergillus karnatakaensis]|uniref:uncharacterized protein n=1 Tax=Aspergillus karnatakaensis TaxID=1810916 RepID=UPI003CCD8F53